MNRRAAPVLLAVLLAAGACRQDDGEAINPRSEDPAVRTAPTPEPTAASATPGCRLPEDGAGRAAPAGGCQESSEPEVGNAGP